MENAGYIHSVETFGTVDGPGTRYIIFFQGCPLKCRFCHNRDTWAGEGKQVLVPEILEEINGYKDFYLQTGGGVTASGGEPTLQPAFVAALFDGVKKMGLNTALDTSGYVEPEKVDHLLAVTDLVLLGVKAVDPGEHEHLTGKTNEKILAFADYLKSINKPVWVRYVVLPGLNDSLAHAQALAAFARGLNTELVEVLGYHKMGLHKWEMCGEEDPLKDIPPAGPGDVESFRNYLKSSGLEKIR